MNKELNFRILDKAEEDMVIISEYIARDNAVAAQNLLRKFILRVLPVYKDICSIL